MKPTPKVSIIVPVYNVEPYLRQCMDSLVNQTYRNIEIICVNDGSTDASGEILTEYAEKGNKIKVISQKNAGLSAARNAGFSFATGDYVMYVDSDDWIDLETCETAVAIAVKHEADIVFWPYIREFQNAQQPKTLFYDDYIAFDEKEFFTQVYETIVGLHGAFLKHPENADTLVTAWGKLYRRALLIESKAVFVDTKEIGTEDALFNVQALKSVKCGVYIRKYFSHYRKNNTTSLTNTYKPKLSAQWKRLFSHIYNTVVLASSDQKDNLISALNNRISLSIIGLGLNALALSSREALHEIRSILSEKEYRAAVRKLPMRYFPPHWWAFFACCKLNFTAGVFFLLKCMDRLKR